MKNTLRYLVEQIVDNPQDVAVVESAQGDRVILTINANPADLGKIIGKSGRIIRALRDLVKLVAAKHNAYVDVVLAETENPPQ